MLKSAYTLGEFTLKIVIRKGSLFFTEDRETIGVAPVSQIKPGIYESGDFSSIEDLFEEIGLDIDPDIILTGSGGKVELFGEAVFVDELEDIKKIVVKDGEVIFTLKYDLVFRKQVEDYRKGVYEITEEFSDAELRLLESYGLDITPEMLIVGAGGAVEILMEVEFTDELDLDDEDDD